jgi:hypothetical protein
MLSDREIAFRSPSPRTIGKPPRFKRKVLRRKEEVKSSAFPGKRASRGKESPIRGTSR